MMTILVKVAIVVKGSYLFLCSMETNRSLRFCDVMKVFPRSELPRICQEQCIPVNDRGFVGLRERVEDPV